MSKIMVPICGLFFCVLGNWVYGWLLVDVTAGGATLLIAGSPSGMFVHRFQTVGAIGFLGLAIGLGFLVCERSLCSLSFKFKAIAGMFVVGVVSVLMFLSIVRRDVGLLYQIVRNSALNASLKIGDIPLYKVGLFPGLCVLAYVAALSLFLLKGRGDA